MTEIFAEGKTNNKTLERDTIFISIKCGVTISPSRKDLYIFEVSISTEW